MDIVLGVSMTPATVRMVLVEGEKADGVTVDHDSFDIAPDADPATSGAVDQVVAAILGTRESAAEGGHHLRSTGVVWTDHAAAAQLSRSLRAHGIDDVILVSELHAAGALAKAIGQTMGYERIALLFLERDTATLAVVRSADGAVVGVAGRTLATAEAGAELQELIAGLEAVAEPPQAVFVVGSGVDIAALHQQVAASTGLPVHAPEDGDLALARGAALASADTPRYEASTVGLAPADDIPTSAGPTQLAAAGYMAPLGYSAVTEDDDADGGDDDGGDPDGGDDEQSGADRKPFLLVGSAVSTIFVVGVVALVISLAVAIRPTADQRPDPGANAVVPGGQSSAPVQAGDTAPAGSPETIQAPIPVVQEAPRPVAVTPRAQIAEAFAPAPAPAAAPAAPAPAAPAPAPAAPAPAAPAPAAPAPAPVPIVIPVPILSPLIPSVLQPPIRSAPATAPPATTSPSTATTPTSATSPGTTTSPSTAGSTSSSTPSPTTAAPTETSSPTTGETAYPTTTEQTPTTGTSDSGGSYSGGSDSSGSDSGGSGSGSSDSGSSDSGSSGGSETSPLWPFGD